MHQTHRLTTISLRAAAMVLLALSLASWSGSAFARDNRAVDAPGVSEPRLVTMAVQNNFAPLCFKDASGRPAGFAVAVAEQVAAFAGLRLNTIFVDSWDEAFAALGDGRADLIPGAALTAGRRERFAFTAPFMTYRFELMVLRSNRAVHGFGDLAGRRLGVPRGGLAEQIALDKLQADLVVKSDYGSLLFDLQSGGIEGLFGSSVELDSLARKAGIDDRVKIVAEMPQEGQRGLAVRPGENELLERLNLALASVVISNDFHVLRQQWYGEPRPFWSASLLAWLAGLVLAAGVCAMAVWRYIFLKSLNAALTKSVVDLKKAEERLSVAHAEIEQVFETAGTGMRVVGTDYRIARFNEMYAAMTGEKSAELLGRFCYESFPGDHCHTPRCTLRRILAGETRLEEEVEKRRCDASVMPCLVIATPYRDLDGKVAGIVESFHDLTRRRQYEALREDVERIMRHDLKAPLAGIIGGTKFLAEEGGLSGEPARVASMIVDSGYRLLRMIDLSLDLFKMETGVYRLETREIDLVSIIARIRTELAASAASKQLAFQVLIDGSPAEGRTFPVIGNELLCHSMLANLVKNAIEASPDRETVHVSLRRDENCSQIRIRNKGAVPPEARARFFEKYVTVGKTGGTGLGAYSARLIAQTHAGKISLDASVPGETTLTVSLPHRPFGCEQGNQANQANQAN